MANNQYNFLDYAGLSLFWNNVKSIIEENELATASALTNLDTRVDNLEASKADKEHTHNYAGSTSAGGAANWLKGDYTYAQEQPNYFGMNKVGALMMNTSINGNSQCKDFLIMDCYWGFDVGGAVAFGVNRQSLGAYIMRSAAERETWEESAELLGTHNYTSYTVKKDGTGASGTWGINISGNAATATKIGTSTVGSSTMPVYINSGTPTAITSFPEAYLSWGGTNTSGSVTPIGMTLSSEHSANRLAFINGNALTFEYSSDAGSTWTDYGYTASIKSQVFTTSYDVPIGRANSSAEYTTNSRTRITLTAQDGTNGYVYTNPRKMLINISSSGGMQVLIEYRTGTNYKNNGVWTTFGTYTLSGWSGWNDIPLILSTLGGGSTQTSNNWQLRLTFIMTSKYADYPTTASVNCIRIFGENAWIPPSTMAATGHLYSFDVDQNATFPGAVTSNMFVKSGGTSSQFLKADGSVDPNTYSKSGHTHKGSEVTLTEYSKASSYSEISASDTVNQAIAKLEYVLSGLEDLLASI